eukprot:CAMPEP_0118672308 /NCGR_PEP_ID=MMETSP0785-20121206/22471_1 /TAXON_ID=91992 /ORGANISM="Bolidomonas pacifica, Strain CCMP 1866" /LENGTH=141 /DNA_ID=CAMNT_0006567261 /DNA_START=189 /DNA_END=611 /DNA_ORIENTATION=+
MKKSAGSTADKRTTEVQDESSGKVVDGAASVLPAAYQNSRSGRSSGLQEEGYDRAMATAHTNGDSIEVSSKPPSRSSTMGEGNLSWSLSSGINIDEQGRMKAQKNTFNLMEERSEGLASKDTLESGKARRKLEYAEGDAYE